MVEMYIQMVLNSGLKVGDIPFTFKNDVEAELKRRHSDGELTEESYEKIIW